MGAPRYSIITVCLNAKEELKKTLYSIEQQTYKKFEWIIIDGQSKDGTVDIVRNHSCVTHLISEPDEGIYDAMNKGINLATGDYLLFLNAGDWLYNKDVLRDAEKYLKADLLVGKLMVIDSQGNYSLREYDKRKIDKKYFYNQTFPHPATFIKRIIFETYGMYCQNFKIAGDHDFFSRLITKGVEFYFLPICVSFFPLNGLSFKMKHSKLLDKEVKMVRRRNFSFFFRLRMNAIYICKYTTSLSANMLK